MPMHFYAIPFRYPPTTHPEFSPLSLHAALPISELSQLSGYHKTTVYRLMNSLERMGYIVRRESGIYTLGPRLLYLGKLYEQSFKSEEHTSELQSRENLVCRLLLEKKK